MAAAVRRPLLPRVAAPRARRRRDAGRQGRAHQPEDAASRSSPPTTCASCRADDFESHEARVCISEGAQLTDPNRPRKYTEAQYLRSPEEMAALFADIPEALQNSVEIARRCSLPLKLGESRLPNYPLPDGATVEAFIRAESERGFAAREKASTTSQRARITEYRERLRARARRHLPDGLRRLLPDRRGLHPLGARERRPGGAGPRFGRRIAGGVQPRHHRHRPAASTTCCSSGS